MRFLSIFWTLILRPIQQLNVRESHEIDETKNCLEELKYRKARVKTAFTKARNQLSNLLDEEECPDRKLIKDTRRKLNDKQEDKAVF